MSDELNELKRLKELIFSQMEEERRISLEETARVQEWEVQKMSDQIEAGLVDSEKISKYIEILSRRTKEAKTKPPSTVDEDVLKNAELTFQGEVIKYRTYAMNASSGPGSWGCYLKKPLFSEGNASNYSYAQDKCESIVKGSYADVVAFAKGETKYKTDKKGLNTIDKVVTNYGNATAVFCFQIPACCIPQYGGRIKVYPIWHLFGEYSYVCNTWDLFKEYMAELELSIITVAYTFGGKTEGKQVLLKKQPDPIGLFTCEWDKILKYVGHNGPAVEVDVMAGKDVYVLAVIQLICKAGGDLGYFWGNYAKLDFSHYNNHVELEELRIEQIKVNPPPKLQYLKDYDAPSWKSSYPGMIDPDLVKRID